MFKNLKQDIPYDKKSILIFGITGQDGSLLADLYIKKKYKVYGVVTSKILSSRNLKKLNLLKKVNVRKFIYFQEYHL